MKDKDLKLKLRIFGYEPCLCGIWPFVLPESHPFTPACMWHDEAYEKVDWDYGTERIDGQFYFKMFNIAEEENSECLKKQARLFYKLARNWGKLRYGLAKIGIKP